jgi:NAD(P)-dependent dehydrogenase (short-subunit alcohol dehydrogenase family)
MTMNLKDRRAVITGANRGLGREIAIHYVPMQASTVPRD